MSQAASQTRQASAGVQHLPQAVRKSRALQEPLCSSPAFPAALWTAAPCSQTVCRALSHEQRFPEARGHELNRSAMRSWTAAAPCPGFWWPSAGLYLWLHKP